MHSSTKGNNCIMKRQVTIYIFHDFRCWDNHICLLIQAYILLKTATQLTNLTNGLFFLRNIGKKRLFSNIFFFISFKLFVCFEINFFSVYFFDAVIHMLC